MAKRQKLEEAARGNLRQNTLETVRARTSSSNAYVLAFDGPRMLGPPWRRPEEVTPSHPQ